MNIFPAQSEQTKAECVDILSTEANFMSGQDSKPMLSIKQDGMTGGYKLTYGKVAIKKHAFMDCVSLEQWDTSFIINKMEHIKKVHRWTGMLEAEIQRIKTNKLAEYNNKKTKLQNTLETLKSERKNTEDKKRRKELKIQIDSIKEELEALTESELDSKSIELEAEESLLYTGHSLFSMLLPDNFEYSCINGMSPDGKPVKVTRGVLVSGTLNKKAMGNSSGSLMHHIAKDYGNRRAIEFVSFYQIIINNWLMVNGFSIGIADCITKNTDEIERSINKCLLEANAIMQTEKDADILEVKLMGILNKARDIGQIQANKALEPDNNLVAMIRSGAKGNDFNIAQITGLVGQQAVSGNRIPKTFGSRTLPHFVKTSILSDAPDVIPQTLEDHNNDNVILKLAESRGFVKNSYFKGLSPAEFFFHAAGGREGLIDSAIKTADTGYIQRKITKMVEDLKISYTGTIVNHRNNILEFAYGSDNMDATKLIDTGKENYTFIDIAHTVECLNKNLEWNNYLDNIKEE
jgi:DNA-directed RNA polymerase beta' subunit